LGGSLVNDTELEELFGPVSGDNEVQFDPGLRLGFAGGYNLTDWFAAEFELGMTYNNVDKLGEASSFDAMYINVPYMVNVKLQLPNPSRLRPYVGAGVGGASSIMDIEHLYYGDAYITGSASDVTFAWQGFAGVELDLNENMSIGVEYRYVWTAGPEFDIDWGYYYSIETDLMAFDDIQTHSVSLLFNYRF
jgi:opacity protein-like surface antigen